MYDNNPDTDRRGKRLRPWLYVVYHIEDVLRGEEQGPGKQNLDEASVCWEAWNYRPTQKLRQIIPFACTQ